MKPNNVAKLRRRVAVEGYPLERIYRLCGRMRKNTFNYIRRCDFSYLSKKEYSSEQARLRRKVEWYENKLAL